MKKSIFYLAVCIALVSVLATKALALEPKTTQIEERVQNRASAAAARQDNELARIIARADTMTRMRLTSLQELLTRMSGDKKLAPVDKTNLTNDVNATIAQLTSLKTKIDADTTADAARTDAKTIVSSYRIYAIYEPKIRLLITIDNLQTESAKVGSLSGQITTLLSNLKSEGKDVTAAQTANSDIAAQVSAINTLLTTDKTLIGNVSVTTTSPESVFVQVRKDMATVRADFAKIQADIAQIRSVLKVNLPKGTATIRPTESTSSAK